MCTAQCGPDDHQRSSYVRVLGSAGPMTTSSVATYVYCAVRARRRPALARGRRGVPGSQPTRAVDLGDALWLIVATVALSDYGAGPVERRLSDLDWVSRCAMAHEAVVEDAARSGPVIPMKLFTLFSSDERARAHVARKRAKIARLLEFVAGRQEWAVRVSVDERRAARRLADRAPASAPASGTGFLLRKRAERDAARHALEDTARQAERIFEELAQVATDARRRTPVVSTTAIRVVLDAAFLVPDKAARAFRKIAAEHAKARAGDGVEVSLTGPWPPYTFVSESA